MLGAKILSKYTDYLRWCQWNVLHKLTYYISLLSSCKEEMLKMAQQHYPFRIPKKNEIDEFLKKGLAFNWTWAFFVKLLFSDQSIKNKCVVIGIKLTSSGELRLCLCSFFPLTHHGLYQARRVRRSFLRWSVYGSATSFCSVFSTNVDEDDLRRDVGVAHTFLATN